MRRLTSAAAVAVLALALSISRGDGTSIQRPAGAPNLTYRVEAAGGAAVERTARVMRERLSAAAINDADVAVSSSASLTITASAGARADVTALVQRGRVAIYDWERSVLGPRRAPAPRDANVTGGTDAGRAAAITKAEAAARAAGRRGGRVVRAEDAGPTRWFALGGDPAMTDADIASAGSGVDPMAREPIVTIEFTARGQRAFSTLTRNLARRGSARAANGVTDIEASQHFAIVIDDQIVAVPHIDFRAVPDGIDGTTGAQIQGDFTPLEARRTAAILSTGPLPVALSNPTGEPATRSR